MKQKKKLYTTTKHTILCDIDRKAQSVYLMCSKLSLE